MSIELQIQVSTLKALTARAVKNLLFDTCFPAFGSDYLDHGNVAASPVEVFTENGAVRLRLTLELFFVSRPAVLAAANATPAGATAPAYPIALLLELNVNGRIVSLRCVHVDLKALAAKLGASAPVVEAAICGVINTMARMDLTQVLTQLGTPAPTSSKTELFGNIVAIRFDSSGAAVARLFVGQEWGLFLDGVAIERLAKSQIAARVTLPSFVPLQPHWAPRGSTPHVGLQATVSVLFATYAAQAGITVGCDMTLLPSPLPRLRLTVNWSIHVDLGPLIPAEIDKRVREEIEDLIKGEFNPTKFGGAPIGDQAFIFDIPIPIPPLAGAEFRYTGVLASPAGMTIGGLVHLPFDSGSDILQPSVHEFGFPFRNLTCRELAKSGSGNPSKAISLNQVSTHGWVGLAAGTFCKDFGVEILPPNRWIESDMTVPTGAIGETPTVRILIPSAEALSVTSPVRLIVRTSRGIRLVDLGIPPAVTLDKFGNVTNANTFWINNCFTIAAGSMNPHRIDWTQVQLEGHNPVINPDPSRETKWAHFVQRELGLNVHLVSLYGLEPGEVIQFRSRDHAVDVSADPRGRAMVPVLLPLAYEPEGATLMRVTRRSVAGQFSVRSAMFHRRASFPAGRENRLNASAGSSAVLTTEFWDRSEVRTISGLSTMMLVKSDTPGNQHVDGAMRHDEGQGELTDASASVRPKELFGYHLASMSPPQSGVRHEEAELNPQPLPPGGSLHGRTIDVPGLLSLVAVPGFEKAPIALAVIADGSTLVLDLREGAARVAGTFTGPVGVLDVSENWALMRDADEIWVYRVTRA